VRYLTSVLSLCLVLAHEATAQKPVRTREMAGSRQATAGDRQGGTPAPEPPVAPRSARSDEGRGGRYAVVLADAPVAQVADLRKDARAASSQQARIAQSQQNFRSLAEARGFVLIGSLSTLANVVFVTGAGDPEALAALPGVRSVQPMQSYKRTDARALDLVKAPAAWNALGGRDRSGLGVRVAVLDSGIDQTHPAFQDNSLAAPAGFPKCQESRGECAFTNRKVIAARSYVDLIAAGDPTFSRPDDLSPRDRVGHGTAAASIAAGAVHTTPWGETSGVAPKAFLGNYKIFGSPGVNDVTFDNAVFRALEDAFNDGMDIASLQLSTPAEWAVTDSGATCEVATGVLCDWRAEAVENAVRRGMLVVVAAGNDGDASLRYPSYTSIHSPGTAPSALTVGATTHNQITWQTVRVEGSGVPAELQTVNAYFGNGPRPTSPFTAPLREISGLGDGQGCTPLPAGSLTGAIALIPRGGCERDTKVINAQRAGAVAVILFNANPGLISPLSGLETTGIPTVLVSNTSGAALRTFILNNPGRNVTLDPAIRRVDTNEFDLIAPFTSFGPTIGEAAIKPDLVAVGTDLVVATQRFDPNGDMYNPDGYTLAQGTSFAAPFAAGAAALVKQQRPTWTPAQIKSALVNTADPDVDDVDPEGTVFRARVTAAGNGKLDAAEALRTNVTAEPVSLSFGAITGNTLPSRTLTFRNGGNANVSLRLTIRQRDTDNSARVTVSAATVNLQPGQSQQITVRMEGSRPRAGIYEGFIIVDGGGAEFSVPYLYQVGDGVPFNLLPLRNFGFISRAGREIDLLFKVTDRYGVPVSGASIGGRVTFGNGTITRSFGATDRLGISGVRFRTGNPGEQEVALESGGLTLLFTGRSRALPTIADGGVVDAATLEVGQGLAPGSYISIFGQSLSEATRLPNTNFLPISLSNVSVSFDVPSRNISVPGRIAYLSEGQINVQIPWELQGSTSAEMKVSIGDDSSSDTRTTYRVPINSFSPGVFAITNGEGQVIGASTPGRRGQALILYSNGLGPVTPAVASGEAASASVLSRTNVAPQVTVGGRPATVLFSGLAPGFVGLYQVNILIPEDAPQGSQPVVISANGISSKPVVVPIN
jgi:minor extracellular serine protease Vpr